MARFESFSPGQKVSILMLLVALYAMAALASVAMANGSSNTKSALQSHLVQALKAKGGFTAAATFLGAVDLNRVLPESSTILVPTDEDVTESGLQVSTFNTALPILQYHVIPKRLAFHDLEQLPEGKTLETLLTNNTVIITNNSISNFSIDDVPLSHRNLFLASSTAVHGIEGVLSFANYGTMKKLPTRPETSPVDGREPARQPIPPSAGKGSSATESSPSPAATSNQTQSSPSSSNRPTGAESFNSSFSPPIITPATRVPASNASSSASFAPVSLPTPTELPPTLPLNPSPMTPKPKSQLPSSSQHARPPIFLPTNCDANLMCTVSSSSSHHLKQGSAKDIFSAVLLQAVIPLAKVPWRLNLMLYVMLVLMAVAPITSGEMNVDVSEVLRNKGGFRYAATYLEALDMQRVLPNRSTVLVPTDAAIEATGLIYNTLGAALPTLKYHVVTKQLSFEDLQKLPVGTMLATLLPGSSLIITSNAASNFTVNDVRLSHPDMFCSDGTAVHGISGVMNLSHADNDYKVPHLQTSPLPPHLIFPLPESAGPLAAPVPVSHAVSVLKGVSVCSLTLFMLLACTSRYLLTFTASPSPNHLRKLPGAGMLSLQ